MAESPSLKLGQIIGDMLEVAIHEPLKVIADKHGLYLDYKHKRPARANKSKVSWTDRKGNIHDLDYVLESGGTEEIIGSPKAFIETAWRRYTKHSRNKVQEIQSAIVPLAETYVKYNPFLGVVLAGVFTEGSLRQLRSHDFAILFYSYEVIVKIFKEYGVDVAFDENTSDKELQKKVNSFNRLSIRKRKALAIRLRDVRLKDLNEFLERLQISLTRKITRISITSLHGGTCELLMVNDAISYIESYDELQPGQVFARYEVCVRYNNGDKIEANFHDKRTAVDFLKGLC
jgi:hypothetical protein